MLVPTSSEISAWNIAISDPGAAIVVTTALGLVVMDSTTLAVRASQMNLGTEVGEVVIGEDGLGIVDCGESF